MKRLVICCDGTWNRPDSQYVTNIEKIARTVQIDSSAVESGVQQSVLYLSGVGVGYGVDRILGGAFGFGLFHNVLTGYRFLASNYEPGDEIYVFGFSRGAYTARSLCGMIGKAGLLTRKALVEEKLPEAVARYKRLNPAGGRSGESDAEFKRDFCHPDTPIHFLGVFDTVGALGVPGALRRRHQFHDVKLSKAVQCARQALAIDEPRMKFEPCLWETTDVEGEEDRVRQVWFEGAHSDVGGGVDPTGLPDTTLLWMVGEANKQGLVFDEDLLSRYVASGSSPLRHNPSKPMYRFLDVVIRTKILLRARPGTSFLGRQRRLDRADCLSVRIAEAAADHFRDDSPPAGGTTTKADATAYQPRNLVHLSEVSHDFAESVEATIKLPESSWTDVVARLAMRGISLATPGTPDPTAETPAAPAGGQSFPAARRPATESEKVT
jgi:uncharacterized protein (DUF2235 family)